MGRTARRFFGSIRFFRKSRIRVDGYFCFAACPPEDADANANANSEAGKVVKKEQQ